MPAPLDLTGRHFGKLTVISRHGRIKFGREQSAWLCRCDCGGIIRVPQERLPHRSSIPQCHIIDACDACRSHPCVICGVPIPPKSASATCSSECAVEFKRAKWRGHYHRYAADPEWRADRCNAASDKRRGMSREEASLIEQRRYRRRLETEGRAEINKAARARHASRMEDENYAAARRERSAKWRDENRDKAREYEREWLRRKRAIETAAEFGGVAKILTDKINE